MARQLVSAVTAGTANEVHPETIRRLFRQGRIPGYRVGRYIRFDLDELREVFRAGATSAKPARVEPDFEAL